MTDVGEIKQDAWGSHLPPMLACLASTTGPVLEVGIGHCSTVALHAYCVAADRTLVSLEENEEWFSLFHRRYVVDGHRFWKGAYSEMVPILADKHPWAVTLIDNSPGGQRRRDDFEVLIKRSGFVLVHDYHGENEEAIAPLIESMGIKHSYVCREYDPPTLVASLTRRIPLVVFQL